MIANLLIIILKSRRYRPVINLQIMRSLLLFIGFSLSFSANAQDSKTAIGFVLSPNFSTINYIQSGQFSQEDVDIIDAGTTGKIGLSGSAFFQYEISDRFFVIWNLGVENYRYHTSYYRQAQIEHPTINRETSYSQYYLQIGGSLKYRIYKTLYARAGIGVNLLLEQRVERSESCPTCEYYYKGADYGSRFKESLIPVSFGVGYELKLNDRLNLVTELFGSMALTGAYETLNFPENVQSLEYYQPNSPHLQQKPLQLGFSLGIIRSF